MQRAKTRVLVRPHATEMAIDGFEECGSVVDGTRRIHLYATVSNHTPTKEDLYRLARCRWVIIPRMIT